MGRQNEDEMEIDLQELFFVIIGRWGVILSAMLALGVLGFFYGRFFVVPEYSSTATLFVLSKSTSITSMADIQVGTNLTSDYMEVVKTRPVVEKVMDSLNIDGKYENFVHKISVTNPSNTRFLKITVQDADAVFAKTVVDELADVSAAFISEKMDQEAPNIISYGYSDGSPVTHGSYYYCALAALAGMVISIGIIVVFYLLNDKIMNPEDIEKKTGLHVLASLPLEED
ncbi:MAG: capsular biosynthesis protein [Lachnospiraceae bacterium]|nr:capsular biosynthesis protein [Lachnospiraceae bacterium]